MTIIFYTRNQFGFQKKFSIVHAIINNKQSVCAVFIDLQKAFDTVDHNILLDKLLIMEQKIQILYILQIKMNLLQSMVFI